MMKKFLKSLSLVMALVMCFTMVFTAAVSADGANPAITFGVADSVEPGAVSITVDAANFADVAGVQGEFTVEGLADAAVSTDRVDMAVAIDAGIVSFVQEGESNEAGDKLVVADGVLFTITGTAVEGTDITFTWNDDETKACDTAEVLLTLDYADKIVEVKKAVVEPEEPTLDENLTISANAAVSSTIALTYIVNGANNYNDFYLEIKANRISASDGFNYVEKSIIFNKEDMKVAGTRFAVQYKGIAMYELNIPLVATVYATDAAGKEYVSNSYTVTVKDLLVSLYGTTSSDKTKTIVSDLLVLGTEAQKYFGKAGSDLATIEYPDNGFVGTPSADYGTLGTTNSDPSATNVVAAIMLDINPGIRYGFKNVENADTFKVVFSYYDAVETKGNVVTEITAADCRLAGGVYYYQYANLAFYAGAQTITATVYDGDTALYTHEYCLETVLGANVNNANIKNIVTAIAKFGKSCQAYFA